ncbi:MAG: tRNA lysidine(34) synthetase TilS [Sphingobacteriales bacterium]|nr:MAG: tRNA lysidine(34) synthetase TilS [Sphingobacteriales bacterium]
MELLQRFKKNWAEKAFAADDQTTLLAVSGGVDSMAMAHLFLKAGLKFAIAHCNFQLRGAEADGDEELVRSWAQQHGVSFHYIRFDTQLKSEEWKKGIQETARILRYDWLDSICEEHKYARLATAHHANDNAETLLMNLFKGTGMAGLHGIPVQNDRIIRPLLFAAKQEVLEYAQAENITWREDASNTKDDYLRNAVRLNLIPAIDKHFPNVVQQLSDSISRFAEAEVLYKRAIEEERKKLLEKRGSDYYIPVLKLKHRKPLNTICYELCSPFGFTSAQVPHILQLMDSESGHYISSPSHRIIRNRNFLIITTVPAQQADLILIEGFPCTIETEHHKFHFSIEKKPEKIIADNTIALIDMKRVVLPLVLRKWRIGDYFYPLGMGMKKKKISRYFIDQKVPIHEKERAWVLESDKRIAWVAGMRLDERFKITDHTQEVLRVTLKN